MTEWKRVLDDGTEVIRSTAWSAPGCHPTSCGVQLFVKDGKLVKVEGDPDNPVTKGRLCVRCLTLPEYAYHEKRITYPMKRDPKDRGKDAWTRISWDEACELVAEKIKKNQEKYGYEGACVFFGTGRIAGMYAQCSAFNVLQTPNQCYAFSGYSCYGPRATVTAFVAGAGYPEMDYAGGLAGRYDDPAWECPNYVVVWGKEPMASNADGFWGNAVLEVRRQGAKLIVIDPRVTWFATRAEHHLQLRPGTDAALALAILHVIINEGIYDHEFVEKWCYGFKELSERVRDCTPEWAEGITEVPADQIVAAARAWAQKPVSHTWGVAVDQNANGVQIAQAIMCISAITGNFDIPGGLSLGSLLSPTEDEAPMASDLLDVENATISVNSGYEGTDAFHLANEYAPTSEPPAEALTKRIGSKQYPAFDFTVNACQPDFLLRSIEADDPYPIRFVWLQSSNLLAPTCSSQPKRWHDALLKMDFVMASDLVMTPTIMAVADLFLPVATYPEFDSLTMPLYGANITYGGCINKAVTIGEAKSDIEINYVLGKAINPDDWPDTFEHYLSGLNEAAAQFSGMSWEELRDYGAAYQVAPQYRKYEDGLIRADGQPGFNTPTGLVELYSTMYEMYGEDPLPYYREPSYSQISRPQDAEKYPLIMTSGGRKFTSFHSEHRHIDTLRHIDPDPVIQINPATAEEHGIAEGTWVTVENMFGDASFKAEITPTIKPNVVHVTHGWWFPEQDGEEPNLFGVWKSNVNELVPVGDNSKMGFGAPYKNMMCRIYKSEDQQIA